MALLRIQSLSISFGDNPVLSDINCAVDTNERIALVGRNGAGKSTLLKILGGQVTPDDGSVVLSQGTKLAYLQQDVPHNLEGSIFQIVADGLSETGKLLTQFHKEIEALASGGGNPSQLANVQAKLDASDGWRLEQRVSETLTRMQLDRDTLFQTLSGGMKRRVLLARALLSDPDVLLLDEPTNHLDIPSIEWLEDHLANLRCSLIFVTHDRSFLRKLATRIIEIDRGDLTDWPGDYENYQRRKAEQYETESRHNALFDKKLAQEEVWIRQGIKARRTRNEGRVRDLKKLREERRARIEVQGKANLNVNKAGKSGKRVIEAESISFSHGDFSIVQNFSTAIMRGDKIGVIGPNGIGKSTLVKLLLGELQPDKGEITFGTGLEIAYFDQLRASLKPELSAIDNVSGGKDNMEINGISRHVISYMADFLFSPERARAPITALSGGETNRLMLAKLFAKPSNFLILDEPTNDLDVETLELLETLVADYEGTVLLISHDREFIENTVTSTIVFESAGVIREYVGGYSDWLRQRPKELNTDKKSTLTKAEKTAKTDQSQGPATVKEKVKKLSYKDQRELDELPGKIETLENRITELEGIMSQPDFYGSTTNTEDVIAENDAAAKSLELAYQRWAELEG